MCDHPLLFHCHLLHFPFLLYLLHPPPPFHGSLYLKRGPCHLLRTHACVLFYLTDGTAGCSLEKVGWLLVMLEFRFVWAVFEVLVDHFVTECFSYTFTYVKIKEILLCSTGTSKGSGRPFFLGL